VHTAHNEDTLAALINCVNAVPAVITSMLTFQAPFAGVPPPRTSPEQRGKRKPKNASATSARGAGAGAGAGKEALGSFARAGGGHGHGHVAAPVRVPIPSTRGSRPVKK